MNASVLVLIIVAGIWVMTTGCDQKKIIFKKINLDKKSEIDTINHFEDKQIYLVRIVDNKAFGKMSFRYALIKSVGSDNFVYELYSKKKTGVRISSRYIAFVKPYSETNWGWFNIKNGKLTSDLPKIKEIIDSLKHFDEESLFISETNGYISFYKNGQLVKSLNYGNLVLDPTDFDQLEHKLYQIQDKKLTAISNNADDLFKEREGVFFIPPPGYGIVKKYDKQKVISFFDSVLNMKHFPNRITIPFQYILKDSSE
jgi:hypothetical protein